MKKLKNVGKRLTGHLTKSFLKNLISHVILIRKEFHFPPRAFLIWFYWPAPAPRFGGLM